MKTIFIGLLAVLLLTSGCSSPRGVKAISQAATTIISTVALQQNPEIRPYLVEARPIICAAAMSTNADPDLVIGDLETISNENAIYVSTINSLFALAFAYYPEGESWQASLDGVCSGLTAVLRMPAARSGAPLASPKHSYPYVRMPGR